VDKDLAGKAIERASKRWVFHPLLPMALKFEEDPRLEFFSSGAFLVVIELD
jgi:hypothetical protein